MQIKNRQVLNLIKRIRSIAKMILNGGNITSIQSFTESSSKHSKSRKVNGISIRKKKFYSEMIYLSTQQTQKNLKIFRNNNIFIKVAVCKVSNKNKLHFYTVAKNIRKQFLNVFALLKNKVPNNKSNIKFIIPM